MASFGNDVTLVAAGTVATATGTSAAIELDNKGTARLALVITAATGTTPSITVTIQTSLDSGATDSWRTVGSAFAAQTAAGTVRQSFPGCDRYIRASYVITGTTPSITFGISGEAV
jgi:hypothetical protein